MNGNPGIRFWGSFASPEMEKQYRREKLAEDLKHARFLLLIFVASTVMFLLNDWRLRGGTPLFLILAGSRALAIAISVVVLFRLRNSIAPESLDVWLLSWSSMALAWVLYVGSTRPLYWMNHALSVLVIVAVSLLVPMRGTFQAWAATLFGVGELVLFVSKRPDSFMLMGNVTALLLAIIIGLVSSRKLHRTNRQAFAASVSERDTIGKLEAALAEVRKLEGILPICAGCKKIREGESNWKSLESYVSAHSEARFSHGLCPECRDRLYPDYPTRPTES
jgi:hypothetical protein